MRSIFSKTPQTVALTIAATLALTGCGKASEAEATNGEALAKVEAPSGTDWTKTVSKSEAGGHVLGNPEATISLIEFGSLTCGHCAAFEEEAFATIRDKYVASGLVKFELRNFLLNPYDIPATILTQCGGPEKYYPLTTQMFGNQNIIFDNASKAGQPALQATFQLPEGQRWPKLASQLGLIEFFAQRGISKDQANACLADTAATTALVNNTNAASAEYDITGTPTFVLNGKKIDFAGWADLETKLQALGAR